MKGLRKFLILLPVLLLIFIPSFAKDAPKIVKKGDIILEVRKLSDRVMVLTEESPYTNNIVVINSQKGLVVVDTSSSIATAKGIREIAETEFKRNDFAYIILTHHHWDHTCGNQVFADIKIIGHERTVDQLKRSGDNQRYIDTLKSRIKSNKAELAGMAPKSDEAQKMRSRILFNTRSLETQQQLKPTAPEIAFKDRLTLDLGDLTINLIYFGRAHSGSDILVQVPEEGLLLTGDLFLDENWLPLFAGSAVLDVPMWIDALQFVLDGESPVNHVIPSHKSFWNPEKLAMWRDYIVKHWQAVNAPEVKRLDFEAFLARYPLEEKYFYLKDLGHTEQRIQLFHRKNLESFWMQTKKSAAAEIEKVIATSGIKAAVKGYHKLKADPNNEYHFGEQQFNNLGYRLLGNKKIKEAIAIFELNVAAYPDSGNAYDSLGEAYAIDGNREAALKSYRKSVQLDPDNGAGKAAIKRLEKKTR